MADPAQTDRAAECVTVRAGRDLADQRAVAPDGLVVVEQRLRVAEGDPRRWARGRFLTLGEQRAAPDEGGAFVETHREAQSSLERRILAAQIVPPRAIRLLDPQRVHRVIARVPQSEALTRRG